MSLSKITLQNFRNYPKASFQFKNNTTIIIGPNTAGKSNIIESIALLSTGKSFRAEKDIQMIAFGQEIARATGVVGATELEVMLTTGNVGGKEAPLKKYLVNGVSKRRVDFAGLLPTVLFSPIDLEIVVDSPSIRRKFLDDVLEQVDREYRLALLQYIKGLRQRNALLERVQETGVRSQKQFEYWDEIVIKNGQLITQKREELIVYLNDAQKDIFDFAVYYDKSVISEERLLQYKDAEAGAGVTLVGPHRDDFAIHMHDKGSKIKHDVKLFGSRGQQRLAILQLKLLQLTFIEEKLKIRPLLLLDDIFSELDESHINLVMEITPLQQTIMTTTHKELIGKKVLAGTDVIELKK